MSPNSWYTRLQQENYICRKMWGYLHDSLAAVRSLAAPASTASRSCTHGLATQHRKVTSTAMAPSPADAAIALRLAASGAHNDAADVSGDGHVTSLDALMILQAAAGRIEL